MTPSEPGQPSNPVDLFAFGDLSTNFEHVLLTLLHMRKHDMLQSFFDRVAFRFREDLGKQPAEIQYLFPRFTSLIDIVAKLGETEGTPVLRFFLLTVYQVASFILVTGARQFPSPRNSQLLGICTGAFSAAAVSVSTSILEVIHAGVEAAQIAFRTALCSFTQRNAVSSVGNHSWSALVSTRIPVQSLLDESQNYTNSSKLSCPYISATSPTAVTVSGPPDDLAYFLTKNGIEQRMMPIQSPFHAPHLFSTNDVESIMGNLTDNILGEAKPHLPLLSCSTGELIIAPTYRSLLRAIITDTLLRKVQWEAILEGCGNLFKGQWDHCNIYPIHSQAVPLMSNYLTKTVGISLSVVNIASPVHSNIVNGASGRFEQSKIAVIGYSGRFPEAATTEAYWELLHAGRDVHRTIPKDRFDWEAHFDATGKTKNTSKVKYGCFINEPGLFDTKFFNMSPREADNTDPAQRLAITATYEAIEMAGMVPNRTPSTQQDRIGVYFGVTSDDWREVNSGQNVDTYFIPGGNRAFVPGRISYFFRFSGPSLSIDTACSSSFAAIQTACNHLWRGECDTAITGGTNVLTNPDNFAGLDRGHFLSTTGNCNAFDDEASGYCRADAVGAVILKRLEDAVADCDPIFGVITGTNTNHCGQTDSITRPHEGDQQSVFKRVLRTHNVDPNSVSYIEMHGTGTQAGDATEMRSVLSVFLPDYKRRNDQPLFLGSAKANIGHSGSASGVSSLIKVLLMMKHQEIPPHCGIKGKINRNYPTDLAERNVKIASKPISWRRQDSAGGTRRVFLNNFSAAGGNTAILLEDAPEHVHTESTTATGPHIVAVTAKSATALRANIKSLIQFLETNPSTSLPALAYTTTARRLHYNHRAVCSGDSVGDILMELKKRLSDVQDAPNAARTPKIVFTFAGQGSLYPGLGRHFFEEIPEFRDDMIRFDHLAQQHAFPSFLPLMEDSFGELDNADVCSTHLLLVCFEMALCRLLISWNVCPAGVVGHSLGEYAAFYAAGILSAKDVIFLVGTRAKMLLQYCTARTHAMLAIKASVDTVLPWLQESNCELACINQPLGTVVSGDIASIKAIADTVRSRGYEAVLLDIPFAFHSAQVDPILDEFQTAAQTVSYCPAKIPVLSPLLKRAIKVEDVVDGTYLAKACRGVVDFHGALQEAKASGVIDDGTIWLEIGPDTTCSNLTKAIFGSQTKSLQSLRKSKPSSRTISTVLEVLYTEGLNIDWNNFHRPYPARHQVINLPRYNWDLKNHWIMYRNNFCLQKGDETTAKTAQKETARRVARYISPSLQRVVEEHHDDLQSTMVVESDVFHEKLLPVFQGHLVNGVALCPSSLYGDIAFTIAEDLLAHFPKPYNGLDVCDVHISRPFVVHATETSHLFRVTAKAQWESKCISLVIHSIDSQAIETTEHARLNVRLSNNKSAWIDQWRHKAYLITGRIASLRHGLIDGNVHKLKRPMVYKLFESIVRYNPKYQGIQEVVLDSDQLEASAKVVFQGSADGFHVNPHWIDRLGQIAGFIMNGNEYLQPEKQVYVNHGWGHMRFVARIEHGKVYTTYNRMQVVEGTLHAGDTYVLDGDTIVAIFEGVTFQGVPRRVLDNLLPSKVPNAQQSRLQTPNKNTVSKRLGHSEKVVLQEGKPAPRETISTFNYILTIISEETGTDKAELLPESKFVDIGIDSLLSLNVCSRICEETGIDLSPSLFVDCPTIQDLHARIGEEIAGTKELADQDKDSLTDEPDSGYGSPHPQPDIAGILRRTIAEESGIEETELSATSSLADLGVDSLLGLTIVESLSELLGMKLSSSMLLEHDTLGALEATLTRTLGLDRSELEPKPTSSLPRQTESNIREDMLRSPNATSVMLQGSRVKPSTPILFLFPDGSGSAASYTSLAKLGPNVAICGLNCPWRTTPEDMAHSQIDMPQLVAKFVAEIRKRQPHGPYMLGGWSAGGICAFEATRQLQISGEKVCKLVLLDSPNPVGLQNPPARMYDFFESLGVFGGSTGTKTATPPWLRQHFDAFINILDHYEPTPLSDAPPTTIIYARDGICKDDNAPRLEMSPDDPREMRWLINNRTDFSADGWATLLGRGKIKVHVLDDVNHFTMMDAGESMERMGAFLRADLALG